MHFAVDNAIDACVGDGNARRTVTMPSLTTVTKALGGEWVRLSQMRKWTQNAIMQIGHLERRQAHVENTPFR